MKTLLFIACAGILANATLSCKKIIDKAKENYVLGIMTDGRWYLNNYTEYGVDNTADFAIYEFQFYKDNRLEAINTTVAASGIWTADVDNIAMEINFATANTNLKRLNYKWKITDSYTNAVFAETTTPQGVITIRLVKK